MPAATARAMSERRPSVTLYLRASAFYSGLVLATHRPFAWAKSLKKPAPPATLMKWRLSIVMILGIPALRALPARFMGTPGWWGSALLE